MEHTSTPVLFLIFNRPGHTRKVFEAIKSQQPKRLFIAADGPRKECPGEAEKCELVKQIVLNDINWDCELKTLLRTENLGCGKAVSEAISWFFENVEEGIILEDDCLPSDSFFFFCDSMLEKYRNIDQVMHINGSRFESHVNMGNPSYYFSNYIHVYGWATWRRAWLKYQFDIPAETSKQFRTALKSKFPDMLERDFWEDSFLKMAKHEIDTWDTQWVYTIYQSMGIAITPTKNMVSNIGFDTEATHTTNYTTGIANLHINVMSGITHPGKIRLSIQADRYTYKKYYERPLSAFNKLKFKIGKLFPFIKSTYLAFKKFK